ncbi:DivIVA domain-containing protein [Ornithinimicrobium faecis]|uniref:DivIVA domain-containing protein n=1 Tax=Ornithinimicrobium faecis TaxID=2934158 RepID=A0ABY4YTZ5_9MICO|nr:DivIVA domain-containing protein [Ornithinimicrobium sp. HY1793]USQ79833.1 DivIVA domain-containing protein [Ornithinimicrobium sp. HY1793]
MTDTQGRPTFRTAGFFRAGYATAEVDDFLDALFTAIARGNQVPDILSQRFTVQRGGYAMDEVDAFLDEVQASLEGES